MNDFPHLTFPVMGHCVNAAHPDAWEAAMRAVAQVHVQDVVDPSFSAHVELFELPRTAAFRLRLSDADVMVQEGGEFVSVNLVSTGKILVQQGEQRWAFGGGTAHVVDHGRTRYQFASRGDVDAISFCFRNSLLADFSQRFDQGESTPGDRRVLDVSLAGNAGAVFARQAAVFWESLTEVGSLLSNARACSEAEDDLWTLLLAAMRRHETTTCRESSGGYAAYVRPAEDFIFSNLTESLSVLEIANSVGVSVPTLNRAFRHCHGMGPKAYVKRQRLEQVRRLLSRSDATATSVAQVATRYAFYHMGQFATDYKRAFGETPSQTLRRP